MEDRSPVDLEQGVIELPELPAGQSLDEAIAVKPARLRDDSIPVDQDVLSSRECPFREVALVRCQVQAPGYPGQLLCL